MSQGWLNLWMWNQGYGGTANTEEPQIQSANVSYTCEFLTVQRVCTPNPVLFKGQL